jgi:drug/metabolite transporter (DMT)-like permease
LNKHVLLLLAAAILWSLGGVLIKSVDWTPVAIAGARSLIAMLIIGLVMPDVVRKISRQSVPGALAYSATVILFVSLQLDPPNDCPMVGTWQRL